MPGTIQSHRQRGAGDWAWKLDLRANLAKRPTSRHHPEWQRLEQGAIIGQKRPLPTKQVWTIQRRLEPAGDLRVLALFNLAIDSKLRDCDLVKPPAPDIGKDDRVRERVPVIQSETRRPVRFELTENTRETVLAWVKSSEMFARRILLPERFHDRPHISTRQYGRLVRDGVAAMACDPAP